MCLVFEKLLSSVAREYKWRFSFASLSLQLDTLYVVSIYGFADSFQFSLRSSSTTALRGDRLTGQDCSDGEWRGS